MKDYYLIVSIEYFHALPNGNDSYERCILLLASIIVDNEEEYFEIEKLLVKKRYKRSKRQIIEYLIR